MPITIHPDCRARIKAFLTERLPLVTVQNGMFVNRQSTIVLFGIDDILPNKAGAKFDAEKFIDESPLYEFASNWISRKLYDYDSYSSENPIQRLIDIQPFKNVEEVSDDLIESFCQLPHKYTLSLALPTKLEFLFRDDFEEKNFYRNMRLSKSDSKFLDKYPYKTGDSKKDGRLHGLSLLSLWMDSSLEWKEDSIYAQLETEGFVDQYGTTLTVQEFISHLKTFFGLSIALRLVEYKYAYLSSPEKYKVIVHVGSDKSWAIDNTFNLDTSFSEVMANLQFYDFEGKLQDSAQIRGWVNNQLNKIYSCYINFEKTHKIRLAGQWLFDSYHSKNELLSFVQTMVALEILLGDKQSSDLVGLNELLSNRCAYLISQSQEQRTQILKEFKEIYDVRSKIVHTGKSRLSQKDRALFHRLRWICGRVISEEIKAASYTE